MNHGHDLPKINPDPSWDEVWQLSFTALVEFCRYFPSEDAAREYVETMRTPPYYYSIVRVR